MFRITLGSTIGPLLHNVFYVTYLIKARKITIIQQNKLIARKMPSQKRCPYSEIFWYGFSRIRTEYRDLQNKFPYSVQMQENTRKHQIRTIFTQCGQHGSQIRTIFTQCVQHSSQKKSRPLHMICLKYSKCIPVYF